MENNEEIKDKALMWYFHPSEIIRLMRVKLYDNISSEIDLTPKYENDLKISVVINSFGNIPYLNLALYYLINVNHIYDILVYNDFNSNENDVKLLCKSFKAFNSKLNITFHSPEKQLWRNESVGSINDLNCFYIGLNWAKEIKSDILIKFDEKLIPCYKWIDDFKDLVLKSDGITFSSYSEKNKFPFRLDCVAMNVNAWTNSFVIDHIRWQIDNEFPVYSEFWFDQMAKQLDFQNFSEKYNKFKKENYNEFIYSGYVHWYDILGIDLKSNKKRKNDKILWKDFKSKEDYFNESKKIFGNKYEVEKF